MPRSLVLLALLLAGAPVCAGPLDRAVELREILDRTVSFGGIDDPKTTLIEALDQMAKVYNVSFDVDERAFKKADLPNVLQTPIAEGNPIPPMKAPLKTVLNKILARVPKPASYLIRGDQVEITTEAALRREFRVRAGVLPPLITASFDQHSAREALEELARQSGHTIVLDRKRAGARADELISADLANVPLETALKLVADLADLDVVSLDRASYVTTREHARTMHGESKSPAPRRSATGLRR